MFNVDVLVHTEARDAVLAALRSAVRGVPDALIEPTLPGVRNGGDVLVHLRFPDDSSWPRVRARVDEALSTPAVTRVDSVTYRGRPVGPHDPGGSVYRTLFLRVAPDTPDDVVERFETDLAALPRYVSTITAWQLSRVEDATGVSDWTHVFCQRFTDLAGLTGPYLMHPIHWAYVDRWFDPECPEFIVRDRVCHSFCALPR
ncbi:Dabb family protein [Mycolicibacterium sp. P1-18]|uniref:Dabb family protein n=1 Tax=Mycolicibacterium sp. P1-18 TaxID=2024615 RepID=UPI0011F104A3|nr:Dabb family protein [Mycolicibacterium sp. P1-18]KAA0096903.1 Dabb family protein [Mycolicibacterium sp. P1-18]